ncbi:hypothetical protein A1O3_00880 [Capronia epimyces CBS 606.96]|uniref:Uncharacterized protein n=1 Tax=Capronia epimyces CBS 606.96 TaxID=1182542 RepID=W9YRP4_9EURO|nr:uncharacterized protein A1O3_00880 [Capronia epimyces CBS 606.96]EXJ92330.1 hypothetical protein A1O3_00880 [Capronia epimyces CBS 606.96]
MSVPSVLEYARFHGLATDHTSDTLLEHLHHVPSPTASCSKELDSSLPEPDFTVFANALKDPKLQLNRQETILLAESITDCRPTIHWTEVLPNPNRWRRLKVEQPLLAGDHDLDVAGFSQNAASRLDLQSHLGDIIQLNTTCVEPYEDEWNDIQTAGSLKDVKKTLDLEKVHATREALMCLAEARNGTLSKDERNELLNIEVPLKPQLRSSSPLTMLDEPSPDHSITSPFDTEADSPIEEDVDLDKRLLELEERMEKEGWSTLSSHSAIPVDIVNTPSVKVGNIQTPGELPQLNKDTMRCLITTGATSPQEDIGQGVTTLSTPIKRGSSPKQKPELSIGMENSKRRTNPLSLRDVTSSPSQQALVQSDDDEFKQDSDDDINTEFLKMAEQAYEEMENRLKSETSSLSDVCTKIPVPNLDFTLGRSVDHSYQSDFVALQLHLALQSSPVLADMENDTELEPLAVPPHYMSVNLDEKIEACGTLHELTKPPEGIIRSEQMLWKPPGLRILDENEDSDEEMEEDVGLAATISMPSTPQLPQKRPGYGECSTFSIPAKKQRGTKQEGRASLLAAKCDSSTLLNPFSASSALATFLDLRGSKFKTVKRVCQLSVDEVLDDPIEATQLEKNDPESAPATASVSRLIVECNDQEEPPRILVPATPVLATCPAPNSGLAPPSALEWCRTVVVDMALLQTCRRLLDYLEKQGSGQLTMIYRDLTSPQGHSGTIPSIGPDMILNPRSGLIFTNLQALNQKSLPGQGDSTDLGMVQVKILRLLQDYDQLFVLVTVLGAREGFLQTTSDAIRQFTGFCSSLSTRNDQCVTPVWILSQLPSQTDDSELSSMSWRLIARHAFPTTLPKGDSTGNLETVCLIHDETLWELFLRKAGMNAMAAQVVLGMLHRSNAPMSEAPQSWGLRRLVQMRAEERIDMFSEILGRRMTERMNTMLETQWA